MTKRVFRASVTQKQFDDAIEKIIGKDYCDFLGSRTTRQNAAITAVFMEKHEYNPEYKEAIEALRQGATALAINGHYLFKE